ncbi:MAG: GNAT family N-acetyltransferase [Clostridia bacterium]|nr:GNAT family N-acetyltransferase [Clostridia bacterium]
MNIIRKLKATELPILTQLFNYKDIDDMIAENTRSIKNGIVDIFVLFDDDNLIGELHVKYDNEDKNFAEKGKRAYLFAFRVHKDYQGKGLGSYLLEAVIDELTNSGYHELTVGVEDDNIRARYMYEKHGFVHHIARIKETYQGDSYEYDLLLRK